MRLSNKFTGHNYFKNEFTQMVYRCSQEYPLMSYSFLLVEQSGLFYVWHEERQTCVSSRQQNYLDSKMEFKNDLIHHFQCVGNKRDVALRYVKSLQHKTKCIFDVIVSRYVRYHAKLMSKNDFTPQKLQPPTGVVYYMNFKYIDNYKDGQDGKEI